MLESSFSKNNTGAIRAISTLMILFTHLNQTMDPRVENPFLVISTYGPYAIACFFYFTGYNLLYAFSYRNDKWRKDYWLKKLSRIYIPFVLVNIFSRICWLSHGTRTSLSAMVSCALGIHVLNPEFWYIQSCILIYILFYFLFAFYDKLLRKHLPWRSVQAVLCVLLWIMYTLLFSRFGAFDGKFAVRPWPLLLGMLVALYGKDLIKYWAKYKWETFFFCGFIVMVASVYSRYGLFVDLPLIGRVDYNQLSMFIVTIMANTLLIGENIQSRFFDFINKYSLYLYLCHAVFYVLYRSNLIFIRSDLLYLLVYLTSVFICAMLLHRLAQWLEKKLYGLKKAAKAA